MTAQTALNRRSFITGATALLAAAHFPVAALAAVPRRLVVYKTPSCGCCAGWVKFLTDSGFETEVHDRDDLTSIKKQVHVPAELEACHTALLGSYVIEGHAPVESLEKLIDEQPDILGIAVPGMPMGSPGMGYDPSAQYDIVGFTLQDPDGRALFMKAGEA